jgi:hypothetical protein
MCQVVKADGRDTVCQLNPLSPDLNKLGVRIIFRNKNWRFLEHLTSLKPLLNSNESFTPHSGAMQNGIGLLGIVLLTDRASG